MFGWGLQTERALGRAVIGGGVAVLIGIICEIISEKYDNHKTSMSWQNRRFVIEWGDVDFEMRQEGYPPGFPWLDHRPQMADCSGAGMQESGEAGANKLEQTINNSLSPSPLTSAS